MGEGRGWSEMAAWPADRTRPWGAITPSQALPHLGGGLSNSIAAHDGAPRRVLIHLRVAMLPRDAYFMKPLVTAIVEVLRR